MDETLTGLPVSARKWLFVLTICTGSFLLFLVQPMVARMALPRLGGAPSVWTSAMLVYQALLLAGYAYADWLGRFAPRRQVHIHLGLFILAALTLPLSLSSMQPGPDANPFFWVPWLLLVSIGPLFLVVSAQAPLVQRWFALAGEGDPYPLYAASNLGSFGGLIAYPLVVEPNLPVAAQTWMWSAGYVLLLGLVASLYTRLPAKTSTHQAVVVEAPPTLRRFARWVLLATVPSGLMLSTSLHLTTDIMAMPLLWVIPLGAYLLSFSPAFAEKRKVADFCRLIAPVLLLLSCAAVFYDTTRWPILSAMLTVSTLFVVSVALHGAMYDERPPVAHLTRFYLAMSVGGVLGGVFGAIVAPSIFAWTFEHPVLLLAAAMLLPARRWPARFGWLAERSRGVTLALIGGLLLLSLIGSDWWPFGFSYARFYAVAVVIGFVGLFSFGNHRLTLGALMAVMFCMGGWLKAREVWNGGVERSFFGIYSIRQSDPTARRLVHGTTVHGIQNLGAGRETMPNSYYAPQSGVGLALSAAPALFGAGARIGVVGLGTGTLACYRKAGQRWRFFEIDPVIANIARNPAKFTFLSRCLPDADIRIGDARLTLGQENSNAFDVLVIDAFSSDSVPMHLLTREALALYQARLTPKGVLLVHISNRMLDLKPVLSAAARDGDWHAALRFYNPDADERRQFNYSASSWIALSPDAGTLASLRDASAKATWGPLPDYPGFTPWTDDFSSILPLVRWTKAD